MDNYYSMITKRMKEIVVADIERGDREAALKDLTSLCEVYDEFYKSVRKQNLMSSIVGELSRQLAESVPQAESFESEPIPSVPPVAAHENIQEDENEEEKPEEPSLREIAASKDSFKLDAENDFDYKSEEPDEFFEQDDGINEVREARKQEDDMSEEEILTEDDSLEVTEESVDKTGIEINQANEVAESDTSEDANEEIQSEEPVLSKDSIYNEPMLITRKRPRSMLRSNVSTKERLRHYMTGEDFVNNTQDEPEVKSDSVTQGVSAAVERTINDFVTQPHVVMSDPNKVKEDQEAIVKETTGLTEEPDLSAYDSDDDIPDDASDDMPDNNYDANVEDDLKSDFPEEDGSEDDYETSEEAYDDESEEDSDSEQEDGNESEDGYESETEDEQENAHEDEGEDDYEYETSDDNLDGGFEDDLDGEFDESIEEQDQEVTGGLESVEEDIPEENFDEMSDYDEDEALLKAEESAMDDIEEKLNGIFDENQTFYDEFDDDIDEWDIQDEFNEYGNPDDILSSPHDDLFSKKTQESMLNLDNAIENMDNAIKNKTREKLADVSDDVGFNDVFGTYDDIPSIDNLVGERPNVNLVGDYKTSLEDVDE